MVRCYPDPQLSFPISVLQGTNYVLFENGTMGEMRNSDSEIGGNTEHGIYSFLYHHPKEILEYELKPSGAISPRISTLVSTQFRCAYIALLLGLFLFFHSKSWSIGELIEANVSGIWLLPVGFIVFMLIVAWPEMLFDHLTKNIDRKKFIRIRHEQRAAPFVFRANRSEWAEFWVLFLTLQRLSATMTLFVETDLSSQYTIVAMFGLFNSFWFLVIFGLVLQFLFNIFNRKKQDVTADNIEVFFEKMSNAIEKTLKENPKSIQELINKGESGILEFKSSVWTIMKEGEANFGERDDCLLDVIVKEVAGFLNSEGGIILIGVSDDGLPTNGIEKDLGQSTNVNNLDTLMMQIEKVLERDLYCTSQNMRKCWNIREASLGETTIIRINVKRRAPKPVLAYQKNEQKKKRQKFEKKNPGSSSQHINVNEYFKFIRRGRKIEPIISNESWQAICDGWDD